MSSEDVTAEGLAVSLDVNSPSANVVEPVQPALPEISEAAPEKVVGSVEVAPAPEAVKPVVPEPAPEPKAEKKEEKKSLSDRLMEELEAAQEERARLKDLTDRHLARERLSYLRQIGAKDGMSDSDLLMLAPASDVTTPEGRAELDAWRQRSTVYFENRNLNATVDPSEIAKAFKESENGTFNQGTALKILQKMTGSKNR